MAAGFVVLMLSGCAARQPPPAARGRLPAGPPVGDGGTLRVDVGPPGARRIAPVTLDAYVRDVVVSEIAVAAADGALAGAVYEAQAIVARTYAVRGRGRHAAEGFDLCATTHCQVFRRDAWRASRWAQVIDQAVARTRGLVLAWDGRPIEAVFHAHCGGHTSAAADVWRGGSAPYLQAVADPYCVRERPARWSWRTALDDLRLTLNGRPRTSVGTRLDGIQVVRRDAGGRASDVLLAGDRAPVVSGEDMRLAILARHGAATLQSTRFDVRRAGAAVVFDGAGAGHGVGLCQIGLIGRVRAGQRAVAILETYYPGARVMRLSGLT